MKPVDVARELLHPLTSYTTLVPMIVTWLLLSLARFFGLFGLFVFLATLFPFLRFSMSILEARARGQDVPAFDAEHMAFIGKHWSLFPFFTAVAIATLLFALGTYLSVELVVAASILLCPLFPASIGVLGITQSPLESLNPLALFRFVRGTSLDYIWLIVVPGAVGYLLLELSQSGVSWFLLQLGEVYLVFLIYGMTGAITHAHGLNEQVEIPEPLPVTPLQRNEVRNAERQKVANHAYGFISRGNRNGGLQHIQADIAEDPDPDEAYGWYFNEMLSWDNKDESLFFAQIYLHHLLHERQDARVLKLLLQCLHVNPRFKPAQADRGLVLEVAEHNGRSDIIKLLNN